MKNYSHLATGITAGLLFLLIYNISSFAYQCNEIRSDIIRLHIIANSDDQTDQAIKLKVRDAVLTEGQAIFDGSVTPENAVEKITPATDTLEAVANNVLKENGKNYKAKVLLTTEYFDTRTYEKSVTLPAGNYLALKIVLGEGNGKNWWCVMFPSLCLPAAEKTNNDAIKNVLTKTGETIVLNSDKYEIRFRIIEYIEKIKEYVDN